MHNFMFVYGTLKRGQINHCVMKHAGGEFVCDVELMNVAMYRRRRSFFPVAVRSDGDRIFGEVYKVPKSTIPTFDVLEGFNRGNPSQSLFVRDICLVGSSVLNGEGAWIYLYNNPEQIPSDAIKIQRWE